MSRKFSALMLAMPALLLAGCEFGTKIDEQVGYRGTAQVQIWDKSGMTKVGKVPDPPYELTSEMRGGDRAKDVYQNVQVLGDVSAEEFNYVMSAMAEWIAPAEKYGEKGGCNYCHNPANMASDEIYTKVVARKMLQMTRHVNASWKPHFANNGTYQANAGVTCWTCHRGNPVPVNNWSMGGPEPGTIMGNKRGQNTPAASVAYASLPYDPFNDYLAGKENIRVGARSAYPTDHVASIPHTEKTYGLMMHMSQGLGVNCTFCHNSNNFAKWSDSRPQRVNAWYGIRMVRDINNNYISSLGNVWPVNGKGIYGNRRGPHGDPLKVNCATCHQGVNKPLGGYPMLKDYPALVGPIPTAAPVVANASVPVQTAPGDVSPTVPALPATGADPAVSLQATPVKPAA